MTANWQDALYVEKKVTYPVLREDGWYYYMGYRFHGVVDDGLFTEITDLERIE